MAAILYRYAQYKGYDVTASGDLSGYTDAGAIRPYAEAAMAWANGAGLITGVSDTTLQPWGNSTRAQVATILMLLPEGGGITCLPPSPVKERAPALSP